MLWLSSLPLSIIWKGWEITVLCNIQIFYIVRGIILAKFSLVCRTAELMFSVLPQIKNMDISMALCV
jgi:hypothetical protein